MVPRTAPLSVAAPPRPLIVPVPPASSSVPPPPAAAPESFEPASAISRSLADLNFTEVPPVPWITPKLVTVRSEEHTSELQSRSDLVCRLLLEKKKKKTKQAIKQKKKTRRNKKK